MQLMSRIAATKSKHIAGGGVVPAPYLGWNTRDALDNMEPGFAVELDNFFAFQSTVRLRNGSQEFVTGLGGPVETLAYWQGTSGNAQALAAANGQIWEISLGSSTSKAAGFTLDRWQTEFIGSQQLAAPVGAYTYFVNGADQPQAYDGTNVAAVTWSTGGAITFTPQNMINIMIHQNVLFLAEVDQLGFWHSPKGSVSPASTFEWFDLSTVVQGGGYIAGMGTMTFDGGEGPDDYAVFVTTGGWAIVYSGGDPSLATEWSIIGRFPIGRPLGDRCVLETAGDVLVLTVNGFISMQQFIRLGGQQQRSYVFNDNIQPEIVRQAQTYSTEFGWQAILVPELTLALFNVPQGSNTYVQYPVNTQVGAWSRFRGWDGCCWLQIDGNLLFGRADGSVYLGNVGAVDVGNIPILGEALTAFSDFGQRGRIKHFQMVRPILETSGDVTLSLGMAIDYDVSTRMPTLPTALPGANAATWNVSEWNTGIWGGASQTRTDWYSIFELGYAAAIRLRISSTGDLVSWKSNDVSATLGGQL